MLNKLRKNNKKGFTLVELIVVLVILAILAALLIPALTGYIDKAKQKQIVAETRQSVMAAQTLADEEYAKGKSDTDIKAVLDAGSSKEVKTLADVPADAAISEITVTGGKITNLTYTRNSLKCTYEVNTTTGVGSYSDPATITTNP